MKKIARPEYLNRLLAFKDKKIIKIITGIRRCGKSTLMELYQDYLMESGVQKEQFITINFEDYDNISLLESANLHSYVKERLSNERMTYIFLDEIQNVTDFPKVIDSLFLRDQVDIYLTGSNAYMLSADIATLISGRYVEIQMLPLSFREYVDSTGDRHELSHKYRKYIENSSFPFALELWEQPREIREYLNGIFNTVVVKDISQRRKITDTLMLESVTRFIYDNIGNPLSTKKIADTMTSNGRRIDIRTVEKYIDALMSSFVLYRASRYNIKGKQHLKTLEKYYAVDIGIRTMLLGTRSTDIGHILENIIYLELLRRGDEVYVGKLDDLEIDFVCINEKRISYYQVAASVRDSETLRRELTPLQKINDHYPKWILTLDEDPEVDYDGIRQVNALDWLMGEF